jgi:hypothetical protein
LQHHIRPVLERPSRAGEFIEHGGFTALHKAAAHDDNNLLAARYASCLLQLVAVPVVKRVVFGDHARATWHNGAPSWQ